MVHFCEQIRRPGHLTSQPAARAAGLPPTTDLADGETRWVSLQVASRPGQLRRTPRPQLPLIARSASHACVGQGYLASAGIVDNVVVAEEPDRPEGLCALQDELRYLLNRWDPIGVYDESLDFPPDEYNCLLGPVLVRLARRQSRADLSEYLWHEVQDHFGLDPVWCGTDGFADRLLAWYAAKNQTL